MSIDLRSAPYYDDYDSSKEYTQVVAVPGRVSQARDITSLQSMLRDQISRIGDAVMTNGQVVSGCELNVNNRTATLATGRIYLDGAVRIVNNPVNLTISGTGTEYISAKVNSTIITEEIDNNLLDKAVGYKNYGKAGSHRVKETVEFLVTTDASVETAVRIYTLVDGELLVNKSTNTAVSVSTPVMDTDFYDVLARRTYDENGSYKVQGFEIIDREARDDEGIQISVTDGKAYINGYEVIKPAATTHRIAYSKSVRTVLNEPKLQVKNDTYLLNNSPAKRLVRVTSVVEVTEEITHGDAHGCNDTLTNTPVVEIVDVHAGSIEYTEGTHYQLTDDGVDWSLAEGQSGDQYEPETGTTYTVTYRYNRDQIIGTDVILINELNEDTNVYESKIKFLREDTTPVLDTRSLIDYEFYLARVDMITLDQNGTFEIIKGVPNIERKVNPPKNDDPTKLVVGFVMVRPGYYAKDCDAVLRNIIVSTYENTRLDQASLGKMKKRIDDLEYDIALSDLDQEAISGQSATQLRGVFTDGFIGLTKADARHTQFNCCIDLDNEELTLPVSENITKVVPNESISSTNISKLGSVYMAPYTETKIVMQAKATDPMLVNPYAVYNTMALVTLNPAVDNWIDKSTVNVNKTQTTTATLRRWWYHKGASWVENEKKKWLALTGTNGSQLGWSNYNGSSTSKTSEIILDEAITYMRQIDVNVSGANFIPYADNIKATFNDIPVDLTPTGSTSAGTADGSIRVNSNGKFTCKFRVPAEVPCGTVNVVFKNANNEGSATYTALGRKQVVQNTTLTTKVVVTSTDPLAQSFQFTEDTILTKVGLYFAAKDSNKSIIIQIRNMVNGYPGSICYEEVYVDPSQIVATANASQETQIAFSQPVFCTANEQYCVCILTDSNNYQMWIATLGNKDITDNKVVQEQPYVAGVLFSSSNAKTWTAHQTSDLKFNLYKARYSNTKGVIMFNDVNANTFNRVLIAAQSVDYKNSGVNWFYKTDNMNDFDPIDTYDDRELTETADSVKLKVELVPQNGQTSPILSGSNVNLVSFIEETVGCYISRNVVFDGTYNSLTVSFEAYIPTGSNVKVYYATNNTNWVELNNPTRNQVDEYFYRHTYTKSLSEPATNYRIKIEMATNNVMSRPRIRKLMSIMRDV